MHDDPMKLVVALGAGAMLALVVLVVVLSVRGSRRQIARAAVGWQEFARAHGYTYRPARNHPLGAWPPSVAGVHAGVPIEGGFHLGGRRRASAATQLERPVEGLPKPLGMWIGPRGVDAWGVGPKVPTGDADFDAVFAVATSDPATVALVTAELRSGLMRLKEAGWPPTLTVAHGVTRGYTPDYCRLVVDGLVADPAIIAAAVETLAAFGPPKPGSS